MTARGSRGGPEPSGPLDRHLDAGAYALGVLDEPDTVVFERHLAVCGTCSARLAQFAEVVPVLAELCQVGIPDPPGSTLLGRLLAEVADQRRARRRHRRLATVAAAALIAAGPSVAVLAAQESAPPAATQATAIQRSAYDRATGVAARAGLAPTRWGTQIDLRLSGVYGPHDCRLVVVGRDGRQETAASWTVPGGGYDRGGESRPFAVSGATAMPPSGIARLDVVTAQGQRLVSVPG